MSYVLTLPEHLRVKMKQRTVSPNHEAAIMRALVALLSHDIESTWSSREVELREAKEDLEHWLEMYKGQ